MTPDERYALREKLNAQRTADYKSDTFAKDAGLPDKLTGDNKELLIIPEANHVDLYDNLEKIPFDKITAFYQENLK